MIQLDSTKFDADFILITKVKELLSRDQMVKVQRVFHEDDTIEKQVMNFKLLENFMIRDDWIINETPIKLYLILYNFNRIECMFDEHPKFGIAC